jgi:hypothetical protein
MEDGTPAVEEEGEQEAVVKVTTDPRPSKDQETTHTWVRVGVAGGVADLS